MKKNMKGITLVSLVITIIVMLILAGVSISMATNNNGVLTRGQQAASKTTLGTIMDELNMAATSVDTDYQSEWAMNPSVFAGKYKYVTVEKINNYLTSAKILVGTPTNGSIGKVKGVTANTTWAFADDNNKVTFAEIAGLQTKDGSTEKSALDSSDDTDYNCKHIISAIYLSDGGASNTNGKAFYVALFYMKGGVPNFVDVGVISQKCTDTDNKSGVLKTETKTGVNVATGKITISGDNITWLRNAEAGKTGVPQGK